MRTKKIGFGVMLVKRGFIGVVLEMAIWRPLISGKHSWSETEMPGEAVVIQLAGIANHAWKQIPRVLLL